MVRSSGSPNGSASFRTLSKYSFVNAMSWSSSGTLARCSGSTDLPWFTYLANFTTNRPGLVWPTCEERYKTLLLAWKFGFNKGVNKVQMTTVKALKRWHFEHQPRVRVKSNMTFHSGKGLMLKMSAFKLSRWLFDLYQLVRWNQIFMLQSPTDAAKQFLLKLEICLLLEVHLSFYHSFLSCQNTWKADNNELPYPSNLFIGFCVPQGCCSLCHKGIHFPFLPFIFSSLKIKRHCLLCNFCPYFK